jgi:hypothetical protein
MVTILILWWSPVTLQLLMKWLLKQSLMPPSHNLLRNRSTSVSFLCPRYRPLASLFSHLQIDYWICNLTKCIFNSPSIHADLELQCKAAKIKPLLMVCDILTCWNRTASMLERTLQLLEALKLLPVMEQHNHSRGAQLA